MNIRKKGHIPIRSSIVCAYIFARRSEGLRFLILRRKSRYMFGLWQQVAGSIEVGERATEAILRELKEETGNTPTRLFSGDMIESFYNPDRNCIEMVPVFVAEFDPGAEIVLSREHSEYKWVTVAEAKEHLTFHLQKTSIETIEREFILREPPPELEIKL